MSDEKLSIKTIKGLSSMTFGSGIVFILQFLTTVVLARVFTPDEFGIIAAVTIISTFTDIFWQIGIGPALVQKKDLKLMDISTGFTTSVVFGIAAAILIFVCSPFLIQIIKIDDPTILKVISFSFIINSIGVVPLSIFQRKMHFNYIIFKDIISYLTYGIVAVILGFIGLGVWGLVIALLSKYLIGTGIILFKNPIKLKFGFNINSFKRLFNFGFGYSISQLLSVTTSQGDNFVITRTLGSHNLGIYSRAYQLMSVPANLFGQVLDQVFFPVMSKIQDDNRKLSLMYIIGTSLLSLVYFPTGVILYIFSEEIITLLFGKEWIEAAIPFGIFSLSLFFRVGHKISDPLFRAKGIVYKRALIHFIQAVMTICASYIGANWGLLGVSTGVSITLILNYLIITFITHRLIKIETILYLKCVIPPIIMSGIILWIMKYINQLLILNLQDNLTILIWKIILSAILLSTVLLFIYYLIWPTFIRRQLRQILKPFIKKVKI